MLTHKFKNYEKIIFYYINWNSYCGGGILTSCSKDQPQIKESFNTNDSENLEQQIVEFKQTMFSTQKAGKTIELNQAVWMMEAVFNYYHGFTSENYLVTTTDSTYIPVAYSGFDEVPIDELQLLFKDVNNAIVESFEQYPAQNKKPYMFDLELQATLQGTQLLVKTTVGTVDNKKSAVIGNETPFGDTDYWHPNYNHGKCGDYEGDYAGEKDASTEWERYLRIKFNPRAYIYHFVDIETYNDRVFYYEYPYDNPFQFHENSLLYVGPDDCLNPDMMNFYFNGLVYIVKDKEPVGKTLANINICVYNWHADYQHPFDYYEARIFTMDYGVRVENIAEHHLDYPRPL